MDMMDYFAFGYLGLGILLGIRGMCMDARLLKYVYRQYPQEEASVNRSHEWQRYPWAKGQKVLRRLIKEKSASDTELAYRARKVRRSWLCVFVWFGLFVLAFAISAIHHLITTQ